MQTAAFVVYRHDDDPFMSDQISLFLFQQYQQANVVRGFDALPLNAYDSAPLLQSLAASNTLFVIIGPRWLDARDPAGARRIDQPTDLVHVAIATALRDGKLIVPLLIGGVTMPSSQALPSDIAAFSHQQARVIRSPATLQADMAMTTRQVAGQFALNRKALPVVLLAIVLYLVLGSVLLPALLAPAAQTGDFSKVNILDVVELALLFLAGGIALGSAMRGRWWRWALGIGLLLPLALLNDLGLILNDYLTNASVDYYQLFSPIGSPARTVFLFVLAYYARGTGRLIIERMPLAMRRNNPQWQAIKQQRSRGLISVFFLSYRRDDSPHMTDRIYQALVKRYRGANVFRDINSIYAGADFTMTLQRALDSSNAVLVIIGPRWLDLRDAEGQRRIDDPRDFVHIEVATALRQQQQMAGRLVVTLLVDGAQLPTTSELPPDLAALATCPSFVIRGDAHFDADMRRLPQRIINLFAPFARPRYAIIWGGRVLAACLLPLAIFDAQLTQTSFLFFALFGLAALAMTYTFGLAVFEGIRDQRWGWLSLLCLPWIVMGFSIWALLVIGQSDPYSFTGSTVPFLIIISALIEGLLLLLFGHGAVTFRIEDSSQTRPQPR